MLLEPDGERTFVTCNGVDAELADDDLSAVQLTAGDLVYVSGYDLAYPVSGPVLAAWVGGLAEQARVVFDPGPLVDDIPAALLDQVLRRSDVLTVNAREAALLAGVATVDDRAAVLATLRARLGASAVVCLRLGSDGCVVAGAGERYDVPAPAVRAVDSTGAGDCHTGVLVAGLAEGLPIERAAQRATVAAALAVTRLGPATAPTRAEVDTYESARAQ